MAVISRKLVVLLGNALEACFGDNTRGFQDFVEAYSLPPFLQKPVNFAPDPSRPRDYVRDVCSSSDDGEEIVQVIEALYEEVNSDYPIVLRDLTEWLEATGGFYRGPPEYRALMRQLESAGLTFREGHLVPIDSEAPSEHRDKSELAAVIRSFGELTPDVLIHHIEQSDSTFENGNWHASINEARSFLEGLILAVARTEAGRLGKSIPNHPASDERRSAFGPCREYLKKIGFSTDGENSLISELYSVASTEGSHPGVTDEEMAKLVRRFCWVTGRYVITKYATWKQQGGKW